jgi:DNA-directed RNA polymerase specialized sigma24 family protein
MPKDDDEYVLCLREQEGLTYPEIAAELGLRSSTGARSRYLTAYWGEDL